MAINTDAVQRLYLAYFNRPSDPIGQAYWESRLPATAATQAQLTTLAAGFSGSAEYTALYAGQTNTQIINNLYLNLFGRSAETAGLTSWALALTNGTQTFASIALQLTYSAQGTDATAIANKLSAANSFTTALDTAAEITGYSGTAAAASARTWLATVTDVASTLTAATATATLNTAVSTAVSAGTSSAGTTFTLTTNADTGSAFTGTANNDTFNALGTSFWSTGDVIDGGAGTDTFNVTQTAAVTLPTGATVSNIETMNVTSGTTANVLDTSTGFSGLTALNVTGVGAQTITSAATTAISVTDTAQAAAIIAVNGGKAVTVTSADTVASTGTGGTINIGVTTAAAGAVTVTDVTTSTDVTAGGTTSAGAINVTGGTTVTVNSTIISGAADNATVLTGSVTTSNTNSAVTVTGNANTTAVTVTESAAVTAVSSATIGRIGVIGGVVQILDANRASTTAAGTIATATITNAGATTVNSGALTALNLAGTLTTVDAGTLGALTTAANTTLALGLTGAVSTGAVTIDSDITTLNISGNTTASTINSLVASGATTIAVSGDALVTLTGNTTAAVTTITVTNTAGASFGTALAAGVAFTGGSGADSVSLGATTKAITMGAGNDTVTSAGLVGTGGSVAAGDGTADTIIMTTAQAAVADNDSTFNTKFTGFEVLQVSNALADTLDLDGINAVTKVVLAAGSNNSTLSNLASGGTVQVNADNTTGLTVGVKSALAGTADVLNVTLSKSGGVLAFGTLTAANVETININVADAGLIANPVLATDAVIHTITLADAAAKTITVTGNNGLTLTNTTEVAVTSFDASGVVSNNRVATTFVAASTDSAANLGVTYTSANVTTTAAVTITGGEGNDTLTGAAAIDTISGGSGADTIKGGAGADILNGGSGTDIVSYSDVTASTSHSLTGIAGMVINLSDSTVTAATIATAMATAAGPTAPVIGGGAGVTGSDSAAGTGSYLATSAASSVVGMVRDTLTGFESVTGSALRDYIVAGASAGAINGGAGADYIIAGAGVNTITQTQTQSIASTAMAFAGANVAAGDTLTFGNGVDIISGFAANDVLDVGTAGAAVTGIGVAKGALTTTKTIFLSGAYVQATGVFTIAADGAGADTLLVDTTGGAVDATANSNTSMFILVGVNSANLVAGNFV